jgi:hypothetical protein
MNEVAGFAIPEGYIADKVGACRSCSAKIMWTTTPRGKRAPLNADGTSHFSTCPQRDTWRKTEPGVRAARSVSEPSPAAVASPSGPPKKPGPGGPSLRGAVRAALGHIGTLYDPPTVAQTEAFARALNEELHAAGYAIHEARLCVRPGDPAELGRAMSVEEARAFLGTGDAERLNEATA